MNELTSFGPVKDIAKLALDVIYTLGGQCDIGDPNVECVPPPTPITRQQVEDFEDRWLRLVQTPGGSHFRSRSSSSAIAQGEQQTQEPMP